MNKNILGVAIDAQIPGNGVSGGVEHGLLALIKALGQLEGPERYQIVCLPETSDWLIDHIGANERIVYGRQLSRYRIKRLMGEEGEILWRKLQRAWLKISKHTGFRQVPPLWIHESKGFYERLGVDLVHIFIQKYVRTSLPTIFNPHDLLHERFPQFFSPEHLERRKFVYASACRSAAAVVAGSRFTRDDVIRYYHIPAEKVWIIPSGPQLTSLIPRNDIDLHNVLNKYNLVEPFILYPAVTWEHKNHIRLLDAVVRLRRKGITVRLVCTGEKAEPHWTAVRQFIAHNELGYQVRFLGYIPKDDLDALYRSCQFVIAPSLFEQASGPMLEAWHANVPVAASNVTSLPDQAGNAALMFDPYSVEAISEAIHRMATDATLRETLCRRGCRRLKDFSWERTAKAYRALYRYIAHWPMSDEDRFLLGWDWMCEPQRKGSALQ